MSGVGNHIRPDLSRSVVVYMEQEDPQRRHRNKVVCAVNLGEFELQYPSNPGDPEKRTEDGRTMRRKMWDEAVQALIGITTENNLNAKYVRNDKNACRLVVKQDSTEKSEEMPDEFFTMELHYCSEFELEKQKLQYVRRLHAFDEEIHNLNTRLYSWAVPRSKKPQLELKIENLQRQKQFFIGTTPDPREMDEGLIFQFELFTLKDFGVTKERFKTVLANYIRELSKVAAAHGTSLPEGLRGVTQEAA